MEVQFTPDVQARLDQLATETGRPKGEFIEDALAGYFEELAEMRHTLDTRYDDLQTGRVKLLSSEEVLTRMREKKREPAFPHRVTGYAFHPEALADLEEVWDFVAEDSLDAADKVIAEILAAIDAAVSMPHQAHRRADLTSRPLRFLPVYDYLVAYADKREPLWVVAVLHDRRSPRVMAAILRGR